MKILEVKAVTKSFQGLMANEDISFDMDQGEIVSLIGPNGAGKTTLFNCIAGYHRIDKGEVWFNGHRIENKRPSAICKLGLSRTFQVVKNFKGMTVYDNVLIGAYNHTMDTRKAGKISMEVLELTGLASKKNYMAASLTIGDMKRLEVARALATGPSLLLLDEVMAGLTSTEIKEAVEMVKLINKQGISLLVVEHVMEAILPVSHRIVVLDGGKLIANGPPQAVIHEERVIQAYLGEKYHAKNK